jgi:hypothetical protein
MELVSMLSTRHDIYFREVIQQLIQQFYNKRSDTNQDHLNKIISYLCNHIKPEKVFLEFALIFEKMAELNFV